MLFLLSIILTGSSSIYGQSAVSPEGADAYVYSLVTDASSLAAGDQFVIVNEEASVAMGADRGNNRAQVKVEITDHTISKLPDGVQIVELVKTSSKWYLKVGNEYLYAPKGSNNFLKTTTNGSPNADYGKATIVIGEKNGKSNVATITFSGADNSVIGHLGTLFSCYSPTLTNNREAPRTRCNLRCYDGQRRLANVDLRTECFCARRLSGLYRYGQRRIVSNVDKCCYRQGWQSLSAQRS